MVVLSLTRTSTGPFRYSLSDLQIEAGHWLREKSATRLRSGVPLRIFFHVRRSPCGISSALVQYQVPRRLDRVQGAPFPGGQSRGRGTDDDLRTAAQTSQLRAGGEPP